MSNQLFRIEVTQAQQASWLGGIRIGKNPNINLILIIALVLAFGVVAFAIWGQVARKTRVSGVLLPVQGTFQLRANTAGVIKDQLVHEDDKVTYGQSLFVINTDITTNEGAIAVLLQTQMTQRRIMLESERATRVEQSNQKQSALQDRKLAINREVAQFKQEIDLANRRVELAQRTVERYQQMSQEGFVAAIQTQNKQEEHIDLMSRVENMQRSISALQREQQSVHAEILATKKQLSLDLLQLERVMSSLEQESSENQARKNIVITSPVTGIVSAIHLPKGSFIQAGQSVATLVQMDAKEMTPSAELQANLFASSKAVGFIKPGQKVWMRYAAYPYQKFGLAQGQVQSIGTTPIAQQDLPNGQGAALLIASQTQEPLYRIQVQLKEQVIKAYGESLYLKTGMTVDADIIHDKRAIWEWIFEPLIATQQKLKVL